MGFPARLGLLVAAVSLMSLPLPHFQPAFRTARALICDFPSIFAQPSYTVMRRAAILGSAAAFQPPPTDTSTHSHSLFNPAPPEAGLARVAANTDCEHRPAGSVRAKPQAENRVPVDIHVSHFENYVIRPTGTPALIRCLVCRLSDGFQNVEYRPLPPRYGLGSLCTSGGQSARSGDDASPNAVSRQRLHSRLLSPVKFSGKNHPRDRLRQPTVSAADASPNAFGLSSS